MTTAITPDTITSAEIAAVGAPRRRTPNLYVLYSQVRYEQLSFWRNPQAMIFTFIFPVAFFSVIGAVFDGAETSDFFYGLTGMQYFTSTIAAVSVLSAC